MLALGIKGKMFAKKRYAEKAQMKKTLAMHEESSTRRKVDDNVHDGAFPAYLLDRESTTRAKVLSNTIKQKRKEKAGKWEVHYRRYPCDSIKAFSKSRSQAVAEDEMFRVIKSGKRKSADFYSTLMPSHNIREGLPSSGRGWLPKPHLWDQVLRENLPSMRGLRFTKAHVTHPELKCTFNLEIIAVKKNPMVQCTLLWVNVSELGLVTPAGKVVWGELFLGYFVAYNIQFDIELVKVGKRGKFAQVTNNPENDGCINAVLLV
ncbi:unnamed protein product [Thlaspi arvense]|uniref:Uncharacterized protein n=1 Tax=Thlaspi arvense TaxID=13288 RepID=A0AAU9RTJ7_THLAR|nr:unnamed protein product [Thlaspi arvense]